MAPGQPEWTQTDTDLAVALVEIDGERCDCGHSRVESMDAANEFAYHAEPIRCHACATQERAARAMDDTFDESGIRWITTRRAVPGGD